MAKIFNIRFISIYFVCLLLCLLSIHTGQCRPSEKSDSSVVARQKHHTRRHQQQRYQTTSAPTYHELSDAVKKQMRPCQENIEIMELCMRCAVETKSKNVYPMCCSNYDEVQSWCKEYIYFGQS